MIELHGLGFRPHGIVHSDDNGRLIPKQQLRRHVSYTEGHRRSFAIRRVQDLICLGLRIRSAVVVVFMCADYQRKKWFGEIN
jgi:hypothetical protein